MNIINKDPKRVISVFTLVMINVIAIDSLRNVPAAALYGFSLVFYYLLAAICFFIPAALVAAELATGWPQTGGVYVWVREAFGPKIGFLAIWLQWIENVIWYPTMVSFIAATLLYGIAPELTEYKLLLFSLMLIIFWVATLLNIFGMRISGLISIVTATLGTLAPMTCIVVLGGYWLISGQPSHIQFSVAQFLPDLSSPSSLAFLTAVLLSLVGMELSGVHAQEVKHPQRDYPKAMFFSAIIIVTTLILASLAIAVVVPKAQINLVNGLIQAFDFFLTSYGFSNLTLWIALFIVVGGFGGLAAWVIGPSKGLLIAAQEHHIPTRLTQVNSSGVPVHLLIAQGIVFSVLCTLFLFFQSINSSYWLLTVLATQLYMLMYALMFMAFIRLRYSHPHIVRHYRVPGGTIGLWGVGILGIFSTVFTLIIGFFPPEDFEFSQGYLYQCIIGIGFVLFCIPPLFIRSKSLNHERVSS